MPRRRVAQSGPSLPNRDESECGHDDLDVVPSRRRLRDCCLRPIGQSYRGCAGGANFVVRCRNRSTMVVLEFGVFCECTEQLCDLCRSSAIAGSASFTLLRRGSHVQIVSGAPLTAIAKIPGVPSANASADSWARCRRWPSSGQPAPCSRRPTETTHRSSWCAASRTRPR